MPNPEKASNLYVKSFFAASIPAAIKQAQRELGSEALLLNVRDSPAEARHLGDFEVVFGVNRQVLVQDAATVPAVVPAAARPVVPPPAAETAQPAANESSNVRRPAPRRPSSRASHSAGAGSRRGRSAERFAGRRKAARATVLSFARNDDADESEASPATKPDDFASRFSVQPGIGRITALVGPPGSGKTSTLVKIAVTECLKQGRPVRLVSADSVRIGGAQELETYATILGVPFQAVDGIAALAQVIDDIPENTYLLIDTPGFSAALQQELGVELATFLRHRQDIDTQLVLTASMAMPALQAATDRFAAFNPSRLIFTRLDETNSVAAVVSESERTARPVSFLCNGQSVPEDILPASKDLILSSLVSQLPISLQAVA